MPARPQRIKQSEVERLIKAARSQGLVVTSIQFDEDSAVRVNTKNEAVPIRPKPTRKAATAS